MKSKNDTLLAILDSIAAEERALACLIDAETQKICSVISRIKKDCQNTTEDLRLLNSMQASIENTVAQIKNMEDILKTKTQIAMDAMDDNKPPKPPCPPGPKPGSGCRCIFSFPRFCIPRFSLPCAPWNRAKHGCCQSDCNCNCNNN